MKLGRSTFTAALTAIGIISANGLKSGSSIGSGG